MPDTLPSWISALEGVKVGLENLVAHADVDMVRGYHVPDPHMFADLQDKRTLLYATGWLALRASWLQRTTDRVAGDIALPSPQE